MYRYLLICLFVMALGACGVQPIQVPTKTPTQAELMQHIPTVLPSPTATRTLVPVTATITPALANAPRPTVDMSIAATQVSATVDASAILWSGAVERSVFQQAMAEEMTGQSWFSVSTHDTQFELSSRPLLIAAYFYKVTPGGQRHGRFLMYQPSGKLKSVSFLFKFDLPVEWVGEHEEYGNYDSIISKIEWEFREPMLPNFLRSVVFSELRCQDENVPFCEQLKSSGIHLPADGPAAEALVMDQIEDARKITNREWPDIAAVVEVAEQGPEWWNDSRMPLLALPRVTACIPENRCATYINMELAIDLVNGGP
jgi:hypothetical protein